MSGSTPQTDHYIVECFFISAWKILLQTLIELFFKIIAFYLIISFSNLHLHKRRINTYETTMGHFDPLRRSMGFEFPAVLLLSLNIYFLLRKERILNHGS